MIINQVNIWNDIKLTTINIGRMSKREGDRLAQRLNGKTYMNFEILVCPAGGECAVSAQTTYDDNMDAIMGMFIFLMAGELAQ